MRVMINKTIMTDVESGQHIKLYSVPVAYSPDGHYIAIYTPALESEPYPACLGSDVKLLLHAEVMLGVDGSVITNIIFAEQDNSIEVPNA